LTKVDKAWVGAYLVLSDFAQGTFPPQFDDQQQAYLNEVNNRFSLPGLPVEEIVRNESSKPFWLGGGMERYLNGFMKLARALQVAGLRPPAKLLELGGGSGWTAEFLALGGFKVVSTTISPHEVATARKRVEALRAREVSFDLQFEEAPMESVSDRVQGQCPFDGVFVFEALHHAFDWQAAICSAFACLRPGGWLLICNEPNVLHTATSYRVAKLSSTHEIGFSKRALLRHLKTVGFHKVISLGKRPHLLIRDHWLLARRPGPDK
jgi:protein-L-isoaspartate O-methyltransferase